MGVVRLYVEAGGTYDELRGLVRAGVVRRAVRGVFVSAAVPDTLDLRVRVASLILPQGGVLARRGAAWVYGVDARPPGSENGPDVLEVAVPEGVQPVRVAGIPCFVAHLEQGDVFEVGGVPATTPMRTAVDLARWLPRGDALAAVDAFAHRKLADPRSESWGESVTRLRLHDAGFDMPDLQVPVQIDGVEYRLDFGWRDRRKALEYDGARWHSGEKQRKRDEARRERIRAAQDWEIRVLTKEHVLGRGRHLEQVVCELTGLAPRRLVA